MIYQALLEFQTEENVKGRVAQTTRILYTADNLAAAAKDAARWFDNRHKAWPDHFYVLLAFTLYVVTPQPVGPDGYLHGATKFPCYEWKCDFPWPAGEVV